MNQVIINLEKVSKHFKRKKVIDELDLSIAKGTVLGLLGLNGAGKTTLLRMILGLLRPTKGEISVFDTHPWKQKKEFYKKIGTVMEHSGFNGNLSVHWNLSFFAKARGITNDEIEHYLSSYWSDWALLKNNSTPKTFSRGEKMQCALCRAFMGWPELLILDEPALALDMHAYDHFCSLVKEAQKKGSTVLISSHQLDTIEELCTDIAVLENGQIRHFNALNDDSSGEKWELRIPTFEKSDNVLDSFEKRLTYERQLGKYVLSIPRNVQMTVPALISELVKNEIPVYEVKKMESNLRSRLRQYYQGETV